MIIEIELFIVIVMLYFFLDSWNSFLKNETRETKDEVIKMVRNATDHTKVMSWEEPKDETEKASEEVLNKIIK
jgi:hypothetical protein